MGTYLVENFPDGGSGVVGSDDVGSDAEGFDLRWSYCCAAEIERDSVKNNK